MTLTPDEVEYITQHKDAIPARHYLVLVACEQTYEMYYRLVEPHASCFDRSNYEPASGISYLINDIYVHVDLDEFLERPRYVSISAEVSGALDSIYEGAVLTYDVMNRESFNQLVKFNERLHAFTPSWSRPEIVQTPRPPTTRQRFISRLKALWSFSTLHHSKRSRDKKLEAGPGPPETKSESGSPLEPENVVQLDRHTQTGPQSQAATETPLNGQAHEAGAVQPGLFPIAVVADRKVDLSPDQWVVSQEEGEEFAKNIGATFRMVSTEIENWGSYDVLEELAGRMLLRRVFGIISKEMKRKPRVRPVTPPGQRRHRYRGPHSQRHERRHNTSTSVIGH